MVPWSRCHRLFAFDAFGTIFSPRQSIAKQYTDVTRQYLSKQGLAESHHLNEEEIQLSFQNAFREQRTQHPNYGQRTGLNSEIWWAQVIKNTLMPTLSRSSIPENKVFPELSSLLLKQFSSSQGYKAHDDAINMLKALNASKAQDVEGSRTIIAVISNSDPRIKDILRSLGLTLSDPDQPPSLKEDIQIVTLSYETGFEKPLPNNFHIAEAAARKLLPAYEADMPMAKVYFGDDIAKDGESANKAGWDAIIVDRSGKQQCLDIEGKIRVVQSLWPQKSEHSGAKGATP